MPDTRIRRLPDRAGDEALVREILDEALIVHVGTVRDGWPVVLPMVHAREGDVLYLHGSVAAGLFRDVRRGSKVCVTATLVDGLVLARSGFNHSMNYRSCVVYGEAVPVDDTLHALELLIDRNLPGRWAQLRPPTTDELNATAVWRLDLATASAKFRGDGPHDDEADLALPVWAGVIPLTTVAGPPVGDGGPAPRTRL